MLTAKHRRIDGGRINSSTKHCWCLRTELRPGSGLHLRNPHSVVVIPAIRQSLCTASDCVSDSIGLLPRGPTVLAPREPVPGVSLYERQPEIMAVVNTFVCATFQLPGRHISLSHWASCNIWILRKLYISPHTPATRPGSQPGMLAWWLCVVFHRRR